MTTKLLFSLFLFFLFFLELLPSPAVTAHELQFKNIPKTKHKKNTAKNHHKYLRQKMLRLREWADYLHRLEHHLDEREQYLRDNFCPQPLRTPPNLCEYCVPGSKCGNGLTCRDRKCQRVAGPKPITCPDDESCGPGQQRHCTRVKDSDFQEPGVLRPKLINAGFFIGKTDFIPDCVMGKVRINCARKSQICRREFCITMTLGECRQDGLFKGDLSGRDDDACCVKAVPVDCFVSKLCRCVAKRHF